MIIKTYKKGKYYEILATELTPLFLNTVIIICERWFSIDYHGLTLASKLEFFTCTHEAYRAVFQLKDTT